jgi:hypothetical protein
LWGYELVVLPGMPTIDLERRPFDVSWAIVLQGMIRTGRLIYL